MKKHLFIICVSFLAILGMYLTSTSAASAATVPEKHKVSYQQLENEISLIKTHVHIDAQKKATLDIDNGSIVGMDKHTFINFVQGIQQYNAMLSKGTFKSLQPSAMAQAAPLVVRPYTCSGRSGNYGRNPYTLYLNECQTVQIEALLAAGAALATIAAIIVALIPFGQPIAIAIGIIGGLSALGAATILYIDASGGFNGVYVNWQQLPGRGGILVRGVGHQ